MNLQETAKNIFDSYFTQQSAEEIALQEARKKICYGYGENPPCDRLRKIGSVYVCGECGCPIEKLTRKISSSNICRRNKWEK